MDIRLIIISVIVLSFLMALWSMRDLDSAAQVLKIIKKRKIKGAIVFFKEKIVHMR